MFTQPSDLGRLVAGEMLRTRLSDADRERRAAAVRVGDSRPGGLAADGVARTRRRRWFTRRRPRVDTCTPSFE